MADTDDKVEAASEELTATERDNFGGQPEGDEVAGYVANFEGDEINGRRYALGETISSDVDAGTLAYLVQNGRITPYTADSAKSPSGSGDGTAAGPGVDKTGSGDTNEAFADLNEEQTAEAEKLVKDNSKDALLKLAEDEGVEGVTDDNNKSEIAAKIVAARAEDE